MKIQDIFESGYLLDGQRNPWMWGKCYDFALALSEKIPDAEFVAIGMSRLGAEHVGLKRNNKYYDCRGEMNAEQFIDGKTDNIEDIKIVPREDVELHAGVAGMKPPYKGNKDIALARRAVKSIFGNRIIKENYEEYEHSRWVHYSDHEMLTVNHKQFHQDPRGIYFFPENHSPDATMWHAKKYKYTVVLKPDAKVLDLPEISDRLLDKMVADIDATDTFQGYIRQYPPADHIKKIHMAWEMMRQKFSYSLWNKVIRNLGYDALFDDKGIIHSHEPIQLIVLNPRCISIVNREMPKSNYFPKMIKAMKEVAELAKQYGKVEIEQPKLVNRYGNKTLTGYVTINDWEHKPYARITFTRSNDKNFSHLVQVSVTSSPHLSGSLGANYDTFKNEWQSYSNIETLKRGLDTIFHSDENSPRNEWGLT